MRLKRETIEKTLYSSKEILLEACDVCQADSCLECKSLAALLNVEQEIRFDKEVISTRKRLIDMNNSSLDRIAEILDKDSKAPFSVQLNAAKDNLDRTGYKVPEVIEVAHSFLTAKDIEELNENSKDVNTDYLDE